MILSPGIIFALILGLALLAHSSVPRGVLGLAALGVIAYFMTTRHQPVTEVVDRVLLHTLGFGDFLVRKAVPHLTAVEPVG